MADEDEATARRRPWHSVYIVLGQELPFDLVFEDLRPQVLQTCLDVLGRSFLRSWPGGPQEMEDSLRRGVEESGAGPVAHGLRRSQAQELSGRLAPFVATQVNVNRAAAEAASRESPQISSRGYLIGASRIEPPPEVRMQETFECWDEEIEVASPVQGRQATSPSELREGCVVRIEEDQTRAQELQGSHWAETMKPSLGESATVVSASNVSAEVVCPSVSNRSQTWNLKCLQPDPSEALYCLDIHDHPLLWCGSFPNCHTCDADCDRRRIWEAYRCAKCDFDVCSECSKSYKTGLVRSRHHLGALGTALLPRGLKSSRHSCMGELLPGGCRCSDGDSPAAGACCAFGKFFICDACRTFDQLGEITPETRSRDLEDLQNSTQRIAASLRLHPSEIFALAENGLFAKLAAQLRNAPAVRSLVLDLGEWLAAGAPEEVPSGPVMVEIENGVWSESHVLCEVGIEVDEQQEEAPKATECWVAAYEDWNAPSNGFKGFSGSQRVSVCRLRPAFVSKERCKTRDKKLREELEEELKKGAEASEISVRRLLDGADVLQGSAEGAESLVVKALRNGCKAAVLEALLQSWSSVTVDDLKAHWRHGEGAPLHGEPRLAMLVAERGGQWATLASEACMEMANVAELQLAAAEAKVPEIEAKVAEARQQRKAAAEAAAAEAAAAEAEAQAAAMEEAKPREDEVKEKIQGEGCDAEDAANVSSEPSAKEPACQDKKEKKESKESKDAKARKAEAEEARQFRAEDRAVAKAKLAVVDAKSRIVEAQAAADACKRMGRTWPRGDWPSLIEHFKKELLAPILEAEAGPKAGGLELNGRFGAWLGGLLRAGCKPTERQVEIVVRRVSLALAEAAGPALKDAMAFVERILESISSADSAVASGLVTALKRHGVEARLQRLAEVGAVASDGMALRHALPSLRESAQRLTQLETWKVAELSENPAVAELVGRLSEPGTLDDIGALLQSQACTPYELSLHALPSRLLPLLSSTCEWPWPPSADFSTPTLEALVPALQWLLGLCETFPVAAAEGPVSGVDCLVRPLELALESSSVDTSKTLFVEPLLPLRDLERFLLQTTEVEEETYLGWCRSVVGQRIAERDVSSRGSKETWRIARVKSFDMVAKLPVHTLVYDDGEDAKLLLHLREVVALAEAGDACFDGPEEATQAPDTQDEPEGTAPDTEGSEEGDEGHDVSEEDGEAAEKIHKLVVKMPMVQEGEIPFEMVWADYLEAGEAVLQASPNGTWTALGWKDRSELQEAFKASLEANGQGTLARGMTREQANLLLERMDELAAAMSVVVDRTDVPAPRPQAKKTAEGPICRRVQLNSSRTVGVAVWEYEDGMLDVVDQSGRFLPKVPSSQILPPSNRARHAPGRSLPLELSVLGLSGNSSGRGDATGEWQFAGDQGWCKYDAAASRLLEAARERGEDSVSVRSGSNRYMVDIRAGTQTNMTHPGRRVRRVRRLATGSTGPPSRNGAFLALERNFSAVDRGPVNDFEQKVLERKLGEEHFRQDEDLPSDDPITAELANGVPAPRLHVDFFRVPAGEAEEPLPLQCTVLQALLWPESAGATASTSRSVDQRLRYVLRESTQKALHQERAPSTLRRDHTGVQAAGRAGAEGESATLLALLRRLRRLTSGCNISWENDQLNRKLAHQLAQPLLTAGGVVPSWVKALPLTYPFLFERKLKEQLLHCMGFGTSHAVLWLQRRCVEARFGEQLRLARERVARTGNDAELWELHEQAAADESVFVGAGRSEMARLPGRGSCNLLEIAERVIQLTYNSRALLEVVFDDETGFGDGVTQSFYTDVAAELCGDTEEAAGLWAEHLPSSRVKHQGKTFLHSRRGLFPRPHVPGSPKSLAACKRFRFLGRLMAKALRDGFIVPVTLCPHFFEAVLGADLPLEALPSPGDGWAGEFLGAAARFARDRRSNTAPSSSQPGWAAKYLQAKGAAGEMSFDEYCQHCYFLETGSSGMEICEGGGERILSSANLEEFVECAAHWWLRDGIMPQVEAFRHGVEDVCDSPAIWAFEAEELQELMCGQRAPEWTEKELKQHLKCRGGGSPTVKLLIQELVSMTPEQKSQFLEFVTACPRLPHGGLAAAEIAVVAAQPKGSLPRAHTCTNELQLPSYDSVEELSTKLREAMENARGMYE